ncbi:LytR family transcriptional regulator [Bacillus sp. AGMB 02131]|uniref:Polyisoprenyl-teichoic acid--peptidoglycan teichoic acid transferase TagU n=1 Tax=Peribacillus faecalis TaxID=2772559 RepID=A0A927HCM8_9BACI|nr:LytR family transcriptional regulator [Peribacillus faecalis]MBD3109792.1 LytR family transcriptional regulator [Peribacillus faecalis]
MEKKAKKKFSWFKIIGIIVLLIVAAGGIFAFTVYKQLENSVDQMYTPIDRESEKREETLELKEQQPFSVLLLGVDERDGDSGRSDSMIVLTVNPHLKGVKMVSIPRDTRVEIVGRGTVDKINHAYAFGGIEMSMDTVENFLDIPIDYYVQINMESFKDIVDAIGGITVNNELDFNYEGQHFPIGTITLNGDEALKYSRMRYEDPNGDFGRQARQRKVIEAVIKQGASLTTLTNYKNIFDTLGNNIQTNLTFNEMKTIQSDYRAAADSIEQISIEGSGTKINGIYYYQVPEVERENIQNQLKEQLGI